MFAFLLSAANAATTEVEACLPNKKGQGCPDTFPCPTGATCFYRDHDNCNKADCVVWGGPKVVVEYAPQCAAGNYQPASQAVCDAIDRCLHRSMPRQTCPGNHCLRRTSCCHWECQDPQATAAEESGCPTKATWCAESRQTCPATSCADCEHEFANVKCTTTNVDRCRFQVWKSTAGRRRFDFSARRRAGAPEYKCPESNDAAWCYVVDPKNEASWQCRKKADEGETAVCSTQPNLANCPVCDVMSLPGGKAQCALDQCLVQTGCCKWECKYIHDQPMCPTTLQPALTTCLPDNDPANNDRRREEDEDEELECESDECIAYTGCWGKAECIHNSAKWEKHENHVCVMYSKAGVPLDIGSSTVSKVDAHRKCLGHNKHSPVHECTGVYDAACDQGGHSWILCTNDQKHPANGQMNLLSHGKFTPKARAAPLGCTYGLVGKPYVKTTARRRLDKIMERLRRMEL